MVKFFIMVQYDSGFNFSPLTMALDGSFEILSPSVTFPVLLTIYESELSLVIFGFTYPINL